MKDDHILQLSSKLDADWPSIQQARNLGSAKEEMIRRAVEDLHISEDVDLVIYGSIARGEVTEQSDVDWTLLIDSAVDTKHFELSKRIANKVKTLGLNPPAKDGAFGSMTFSHDLIHKIGGIDDTNTNMTQRLLLLSESITVGSPGLAYGRVTKSIIRRYLEEEVHLVENDTFKIPRFLLNDVVRFWRTIAVDFAHKQRAREGDGWGIRNLKLRMSRKLIFVAGMLSCFECETLVVKETDTDNLQTLISFLEGKVMETPLQILAEACLNGYTSNETALKLFNSYESFLDLISRERTALQNLRAEESERNSVYRQGKEMSAEFEEGLDALFFGEKLQSITHKYAIF